MRVATFVNLEKEIEKIKKRNRKVERDKAWETSWTRRIFIGVSTYIVVVVLFYAIGVAKPLLSAIVPAAAYVISTFSLGILKTWWLRNRDTITRNGIY